MLAARVSVSIPRTAAPCVCQNVVVRQATLQAPTFVARAAATESAVDNAFVYGEDEGAAPAETGIPAPKAIALPSYHLNILYLDKCIGIAVDQQLASGEKGPVTEYFMWPAKDAWDLLKTALEGMPWISQTEAILLLNGATKIINYWQDEETKHTMDDAKVEYPDMTFFGA